MLLVPIIAVVMSYLLINIRLFRKGVYDRILAVIAAITVNTGIVLLMNEALSVPKKLEYKSILICWLAIVVVQMVILIHSLRKQPEIMDCIRSSLRIPKIKLVSIETVSIVVIITALVFAVMTVPYNWDSMSYHMSRVIHWTQEKSIAHYACHDISQISDPYLAEFICTHIYILSGKTDYFVNLLQTESFIVTAIAVYGISKKIGCGKLFRSLAVLLYVTTPIVFAESLTTQVDVFAGMWLVMFAYVALDFTNKDRELNLSKENIFRLLLMGLMAGFSYDAKASASVGIAVFAIWILVCCIRKKDKIYKIFTSVIMVAVPAVLVMLPEILRNFATFNAMAAEESSTQFVIPSFDPRYVVLNCLENIGFNLPNVYFEVRGIGDKIIRHLVKRFFGSDDTPEGLFDFSFTDNLFNMSHDSAVNPIVMWLMLFTICAGLILWCIHKVRKIKENSEVWEAQYVGVSIIATLLFLVIARWYAFITRYECGYFAILLPGEMLLLQMAFANKKVLVNAITGILVFVSLSSYQQLFVYHKAYALNNKDRYRAYFQVRDLYDTYEQITSVIKTGGYKQVGFICGPDSYEYPFWKMIEDNVDRVEHACVVNETQIYDDGSFIPECIVSVDVEYGEQIEYQNEKYKLSNDISGMKLYVKE